PPRTPRIPAAPAVGPRAGRAPRRGAFGALVRPSYPQWYSGSAPQRAARGRSPLLASPGAASRSGSLEALHGDLDDALRPAVAVRLEEIEEGHTRSRGKDVAAVSLLPR